jgi:hypothetical protein
LASSRRFGDVTKTVETRSDTGQSGFSCVGLTGFEPATT